MFCIGIEVAAAREGGGEVGRSARKGHGNPKGYLNNPINNSGEDKALFSTITANLMLHPPFFLPIPQFVTRASSTVRAGLKEPAKSKAMAQEHFAYNSSKVSGENKFLD